MLRIPCPWCGERDEVEFRYQGDAGRTRPAAGAAANQVEDYLYLRDNPRGWHLEWWLHTAGCRQLIKVLRHTVTHEIAAVGGPADSLSPPESRPVPAPRPVPG